MFSRTNFLGALLLFLIHFTGYTQQFEWARHWGNDASQWIHATIPDNNDNVYIIGHTNAPGTDIDPGPGVSIIPYNLDGSTAEVYLVKLDSQGNFVWGKSATDGNPGNFEGIMVIPGTDGFLYTAKGENVGGKIQYRISKLDAAGNIVASKTIINTSTLPQTSFHLTCIALDANNTLYLDAKYENAVLEPDNPVTSLQGKGEVIMKMDANFNFLWNKTLTDLPTSASWYGIQVRPDGKLFAIYTTQHPNSTQTGTYPSFHLCTLDPNGNMLWTKDFEHQKIVGCTISPSGDIVLIGSFGKETIDVDPSTSEKLLTPPNTLYNQYLMWLSPSGDFKNVIPYYLNTQDFRISGVAVDNMGNTFFAAEYEGVNIDVDPGPGTNTIFAPAYDKYLGLLRFDPGYNLRLFFSGRGPI